MNKTKLSVPHRMAILAVTIFMIAFVSFFLLPASLHGVRNITSFSLWLAIVLGIGGIGVYVERGNSLVWRFARILYVVVGVFAALAIAGQILMWRAYFPEKKEFQRKYPNGQAEPEFSSLVSRETVTFIVAHGRERDLEYLEMLRPKLSQVPVMLFCVAVVAPVIYLLKSPPAIKRTIPNASSESRSDPISRETNGRQIGGTG